MCIQWVVTASHCVVFPAPIGAVPAQNIKGSIGFYLTAIQTSLILYRFTGFKNISSLNTDISSGVLAQKSFKIPKAMPKKIIYLPVLIITLFCVAYAVKCT